VGAGVFVPSRPERDCPGSKCAASKNAATNGSAQAPRQRSQKFEVFVNKYNAIFFITLHLFVKAIEQPARRAAVATLRVENFMSSHVILSGSHREHPAGAAFMGKPAADEMLQIACILRRRDVAPKTPLGRVSHQQFERFHGSDPADVKAVENFANEHGFSVVRIERAARCVTLSGKFSALAQAFAADVDLRQIGDRTFRTRQGSLSLHPSLEGRVVAVFGFDQRPQAATRHRIFTHAQNSVAYTPPQVARAYNFPTNKGANQTIALIELGGGFSNSDLTTYWQQLGLPPVSVTAIGVDGATNSPTGDPASADGEVTLDIQVAGAVAPAARIAVYFAPNTDQGFYDAISAAIHDKTHKPSVLSISWGMAEDHWTPQAMNAFNALFHDAALLGLSVCAASGDNGSSDGDTDGANHVDFPASSPWVLGCGGTSLGVADGGKISWETVWNDGSFGGATGGGVSQHFSKPLYQGKTNVPLPVHSNPTGRGVPDVAGNADPATGYVVLVGGQPNVFGGTSAVAPLWAGLIALLNERLSKRVGWLNAKLYGKLAPGKALNDITEGNNGVYAARTGWDPCTGLGTPNGAAILQLLR
jgi:kumamolisin